MYNSLTSVADENENAIFVTFRLFDWAAGNERKCRTQALSLFCVSCILAVLEEIGSGRGVENVIIAIQKKRCEHETAGPVPGLFLAVVFRFRFPAKEPETKKRNT